MLRSVAEYVKVSLQCVFAAVVVGIIVAVFIATVFIVLSLMHELLAV